VPSAFGFFAANCQNQRAIHFKGRNRGASRFRQADQSNTIPPKVVIPAMAPRVEQTNLATGFRVISRLPRFLSQRTGNAGQGEVVQRSSTTLGGRNDVVNVESGFLTSL
jgi:hypothetical protein